MIPARPVAPVPDDVAERPLIIAARVNETSVNEVNPNFPYTPQQIVREALRAWEAGASILHWHARVPGQAGIAEDVDAYLEVGQLLRERCDMLLQPGIGPVAATPAARIPHITAVREDLRHRPDLVSVEFGSFNVDAWDLASGRFASMDALYVLTRDRIEQVVTLLRGCGVQVSAACWDLAQVRTARYFQQMGVLDSVVLWELVFTGPDMPSAPDPTLINLQAMLAGVPAGQPWLANCWRADAMRLACWAVTLGGHVGLGLGDHDYGRFGTPNHGELVGYLAQLARTVGRPLAAPSQTRELLGIPAPPAVSS